MSKTNFRYTKQIESLIEAHNHLDSACDDIRKAIVDVYGEATADEELPGLYLKIGECDDYIERYLGTISFLGLCVEK